MTSLRPDVLRRMVADCVEKGCTIEFKPDGEIRVTPPATDCCTRREVMDKRQRIAMQRALIREAFGKIDAATELFGVEDGAVSVDERALEEWEEKVQEFQDWVFGQSQIA